MLHSRGFKCFQSLLVFALLSVLFASCSKDEGAKDPVVRNLEVVLNVENISSDILDYFSVEYAYVDFNGQTTRKAITGPGKISFSIDNPSLGEVSSTPFKVQLKFNQRKDTAEKKSESYDSSLTWQLDVNAYDQNVNLITDSGKVQRFSSNLVYDNDKFSSFNTFVTSQAQMKAIEYKLFFCKTTSGVWHIGVDGTYLGGDI